jgi:uncharacterized protein YpmB
MAKDLCIVIILIIIIAEIILLVVLGSIQLMINDCTSGVNDEDAEVDDVIKNLNGIMININDDINEDGNEENGNEEDGFALTEV